MKHKLYTRLLSLALAVGLVIGMLPSAAAVDTVGGTQGLNAGERLDAEGLETSKTVTPNEDGTYTVTLDAYATGDLQITDTHVPTDIVLVLDQSGSMAEPFDYDYKVSYEHYTGHYLDSSNRPLYYLDGGQYYPVNVEVTKLEGWGERRFTYTYQKDGQTIQIAQKDCWAWGWGFNFIVGVNWIDSDWNLYYQKTDSVAIEKMEALKNSVTEFVKQVRTDATEYSVDHRIAIVGFASKSGYGNNTEVLTVEGENSVWEQPSGATGDPKMIGVSYGDANAATYHDAMVANNSVLIDRAIKALATNGATRADLGMEMANKILEQNKPAAGEKRNQVVIMFTDGEPTNGNSFEPSVANGAIENAKTIKQNGAKVYTIGIFDGANADGNDSSNKYMTYVSSNYPNASGMNSAGQGSNQGYYLTAKNAGELTEIFEKISGEIGGSNSDLDAKAVMKDVVTQYFELAGTADDIKVYEPKCTGKDGNTFQFEEISPSNLSELQPTYDSETNTVSVTGFDYKENYVAQIEGGSGGYRGKKLVVQFTIKPKDEFWGGNQVPTNVFESSGIYQEASSEAPVENFVQPNPVDVPLEQIEITEKDVNVYYGGSVPDAAGLVSGIKFPNDWRTDYVNPITYTTNGTVSNTADGNYQVTATLSPKYAGKYVANTDDATANVYVYKPVVTWTDSTQAYKTPLNDTLLNSHHVSTTWERGGKTSDNMYGEAPTLTYTFTGESGALPQELTDEVHVKVSAVKIGDLDATQATFFEWQKDDSCSDTCVDPNTAYQFRIHMQKGGLTINKTVVGLDENGLNGLKGKLTFEVKGDNGYEQTVLFNAPGWMYTPNQDGTYTCTYKLDVPTGTYTVSESGDYQNITNYLFDKDNSKTSATANVTKDGAIVDLKNAYSPADGYLTIKKEISGTPFGDGRDTFNFKVTAMSGKDAGKVWYFTINGEGETKAIKLPVGEYTIKELSNINYTCGVDLQTVTISNSNTETSPVTVIFTNTPSKTDIPTDSGGVKNVAEIKEGQITWKQEPENDEKPTPEPTHD